MELLEMFSFQDDPQTSMGTYFVVSAESQIIPQSLEEVVRYRKDEVGKKCLVYNLG